jgi:hypothetical protein
VDENVQRKSFSPTSAGAKGNKPATTRPKVVLTAKPVTPECVKSSPKLLNKSPPKILNSTLNKNTSAVGTTVSLKSKNDGGATFTLKTTSPKATNNNTINVSEAASKAHLTSKLAANRRSIAPIISKRTVGGTTISTIMPKTPSPVVRRVTTFETWYVINVPADNNEKQDTVMDLSLVTLGKLMAKWSGDLFPFYGLPPKSAINKTIPRRNPNWRIIILNDFWMDCYFFYQDFLLIKITRIMYIRPNPLTNCDNN